MRFCRFLPPTKSHGYPESCYGLLEGETVRKIDAPPWRKRAASNQAWPLNECPKEPLIFLKPPSSIVGPEEPIILTRYSNRVEHEGELGIVIGKECAHL